MDMQKNSGETPPPAFVFHKTCKKELNMDRRLNVRIKIIKLLEEDTGLNLHDLGLGEAFLDKTPKHKQQQKEPIN